MPETLSERIDQPVFVRRPALLVVICFIVGISFHGWLPHYPQIWLTATLMFGITGLVFWHASKICAVSLMLPLIFSGVAIAQIEAFYYPKNHISAYAKDDPRLAWLELHIDHEPRILSDPFSVIPLPPRQVVTASVMRVKTWNGWVDATGEMLVQIAQPHPRLAMNHIVRVVGTLERPAPAMNPGQFDWAKYYRDQRILTSLHIAHAQNISIIGQTGIGPLDWLRSRSRDLLAEGFNADRSIDHALLRALLLGDTDPELRDIQEQFRRTGTSHHLSISGMHIAVLGGFVYGICRLLRLRPRWSVSIGLLFVLLYGVIALPSPPVVRSVLLCLFFGVGVLLRRTRDAIQLLALSVLAMLIYHPMDLYNAGFQLSFGTVMALMIFSKPFIAWVRRLGAEEPFDPHRKRPLVTRIAGQVHSGFTDAFYIGVVAWLVSMPLIVFHFNQINFWAIACGIVLAPFVFVSLIAGLAKLVLTLLWPSGAALWAGLAAAPVQLMRAVVAWLAKLPGADFPMPSIPVWWLVIIYSLALLTLVPMPKPKLRYAVVLAPFVACALAMLLPFHSVRRAVTAEELKLTLLSLGAGQCAVVETPAGKTILIDAGSTSMSDVVGKCIGPYLRATQHASIDSILLTHPDYDHISGAAALAQMYDVHEVMVGSRFEENARGNSPAEALLRALKALDIPPRVVTPGQHIPIGRDAEIEILWPPSKGPDLSSNDSAVVAQIRYAGRSILITGDIQEIAEKDLLDHPENLHADVLIAPHHGSSESTTVAFLQAVNPASIFSSNDRTLTGKQRRFEKLIGPAALYRTNRCGAITLHIWKDGTMKVEAFLAERE